MATTQRAPIEHKLRPDDLRVARPIFTLRETGRYLGVPKSTIHQWARPSAGRAPLITVFPRHGREATVPFVGFAAEVLFDYANKRNDDDLLELVVVRTGQKQFSELIRDYLKRITYGDDGWAAHVELPIYGRAHVVVNPHVAFGLPLVTEGGARVEDLVDRFLAGDAITSIADDFGVPAEQFEDVIRVATRTAT